MDFLQPRLQQPDSRLIFSGKLFFPNSQTTLPLLQLVGSCPFPLCTSEKSLSSLWLLAGAPGRYLKGKNPFPQPALSYAAPPLGPILDFLLAVKTGLVPGGPKSGHRVFQMKPHELLRRGHSPFPVLGSHTRAQDVVGLQQGTDPLLTRALPLTCWLQPRPCRAAPGLQPQPVP